MIIKDVRGDEVANTSQVIYVHGPGVVWQLDFSTYGQLDVALLETHVELDKAIGIFPESEDVISLRLSNRWDD